MLIRHPEQPGCSQWQRGDGRRWQRCGGMQVSDGFPPLLRARGSGDSSRPSLTILGARGRKREGAIRALLENKNTRRGGQTRSDTAWGGPERANAASSPGSGTSLVAKKNGWLPWQRPDPLGAAAIQVGGGTWGSWLHRGPGHRPSPAFRRGGYYFYIYIKETLLKIEPSNPVNALPLLSRSTGSFEFRNISATRCWDSCSERALALF